MATKTFTVCTCDICGNNGAKSFRTMAYRTFDGNDGKCFYDKPEFEIINIDLCDDCAKRATNIHSIGVCCEKYELKSFEVEE